MASLSFIIGIIGNIISILVFTSPIGTFRRVVKKKSTEDFKGLPYICTLLSTSLWTFYGLMKPGGLLIATVNGAGAFLQFIYVTLFLIYAPKETKVKSMKLVAVLNVGFFGLVVGLSLLVIHGGLRLTVVGTICAGLTLGMYASPLAVMRTVIKMKSVEFMPFSLSFFLFLNGGVWSVYAVLVKDFFVGMPNVIGFVLGSLQLVIYGVYRNKSATQKSTEEMEEEVSAHLVQVAIEMGRYEDKDTGKSKHRSLQKGRSLPQTSVARQKSFQKILKTHSLGLQSSSWTDDDDDDDVEKGSAQNHV
ncbi:bidirectional sugar transporter SWEET16-like [Macadamia integrifolia]|uniref:bidirectional sugar transporter SWEET16-like n=1 Tax=Macadamia integrifolia TaxID=60698 RepID=UPI001C4F1ED0|nr:bidirectional sugar transporter SWEET16-like [Macadamia integrifolia]